MTDDRLRRISSDDELDRALAALHDDVPTDQAQLDRARVALLAAAADPQHAATTPELVTPLPVRSRRTGRRWLAAAAAVLLLATGGAVTQSVLMDGETPGSTAAASQLNAAADLVGPATDPPVRPGQYRYLKTQMWFGSAIMTRTGAKAPHYVESLTETWVPADQSKTWLERREITGRVKWIGTTEEEVKAAGLSIPGRRSVETLRARCGGFFTSPPCTRPGGWEDPTAAWIAGLPRDPQRLYERLRADATDNDRGDVQLIATAADALRTGLLPSDVRSALYRALAKIPGLVITDRAANLDGRIGIAYGLANNDSRVELIVDSKTGQFIGERETQLYDYLNKRKINTVRTFTSQSTDVVDRIGVRPAR